MTAGGALDALQAAVSKAPFHRWLGLRVTAAGDGTITLAMPWREEFVSDPVVRYTHGGVLASLIDVAADMAIATRLTRGVPTVDMRVDFHKAAMPGDLVAHGRVVKLGRTLSVAEAEVRDADGALIASGRGVFFTAVATDKGAR